MGITLYGERKSYRSVIQYPSTNHTSCPKPSLPCPALPNIGPTDIITGFLHQDRPGTYGGKNHISWHPLDPATIQYHDTFACISHITVCYLRPCAMHVLVNVAQLLVGRGHFFFSVYGDGNCISGVTMHLTRPLVMTLPYPCCCNRT